MIRWIVGNSLKFRYIVLAFAAGLMIFGILELEKMPVDVFPEFAPPRVEVQTPSTGLSAEEVESFVTVPLEQAFNGIDGLDILRSKSIPDLSSIEMIFKPGTDVLHARQLVTERLAAVLPTMPTWAAPPVIMPPVSTTGRVLKIGMSSKTVSLVDMSMISYWTIRARLLRVPGVANVAIWGERIKIPQVQVDPDKIESGRCLARSSHGDHRQCPGRRHLAVFEWSGDWHRGYRRHSQPTADRLSQAADLHAGRPGTRAYQRPEEGRWLTAAPAGRGQREGGHLAAHR